MRKASSGVVTSMVIGSHVISFVEGQIAGDRAVVAALRARLESDEPTVAEVLAAGAGLAERRGELFEGPEDINGSDVEVR